MTQNNEIITVEIAYASAYRQLILAVNIKKNSSIQAAIEASSILAEFPEIDLAFNKVGIFGEICDLGVSLRHQDRIEIYRSLTIDPKMARIKRAERLSLLKKN